MQGCSAGIDVEEWCQAEEVDPRALARQLDKDEDDAGSSNHMHRRKRVYLSLSLCLCLCPQGTSALVDALKTNVCLAVFL